MAQNPFGETDSGSVGWEIPALWRAEINWSAHKGRWTLSKIHIAFNPLKKQYIFPVEYNYNFFYDSQNKGGLFS
jgi:hypothetical protein